MPCWPLAPFWPLVLPDGRSFASFIHGWCNLLLLDNLFYPTGLALCAFSQVLNLYTTRVLALVAGF